MTPSRRHRVRQPNNASPAVVVPLKAGLLAERAPDTALVVKRAPLQRSSICFCAAAVAIALCAVAVYLCVDLSEVRTNVPSPQTTASASGLDKSEGFIEWFRAEGGRVSDKISIVSFKGMGRGILARAPVAEHDELLFVPLDMIICRETIWKSADKKLLTKYTKLRDVPTELLTAFLLLEQFKDSASRWYPYLRVLPPFPATFENVATPLFFEPSEDLDELQDERMISAANAERRQAKIAFQRFRRLFKSVLPADSAVSSLLEKRYLWARFLINSRAFSIRGDRYLVPFGDVFNGKPQPSGERKSSDGNGAHFLQYHQLQDGVGMDILADRVVTAAGQQVFEDYGDNDNYVYFLYHGFIMESNPFDCAAVRLPVLTKTPAASRILEDVSYQKDGPPVVCITPEGTVRSQQDKRMVKLFASLMEMEDEYIDVLCSNRESYPLCVSHANQADQEQLLIAAIREQLQAFPTTVNEDMELLASESTTPNLRHMIKFRTSRKLILSSALSNLEQSIRQRDTKRFGEAAAEAPSKDLSVDERMNRFAVWIDDQKLPINYVELKYVGPTIGYGAFATKPLDKGEIYLSVPTEMVMDASSAVRSPAIRELLVRSRHRNIRWTESHVLLLHLLHEKFAPRHTSRWQPYLDVLPDQGRLASPLFYALDGRELALLDEAVPNDLSLLVGEYRDRVDADFESLKRNLAPRLPDWITLERFRWANAILDSRSIWWSGTRHLVPLLDMVNCMEISSDHAPHATQLAASGDAAVTHASWKFHKGDHIVENYAQPNYIYLLYHGFVLGENSHDCAHFHFELDLARQMAPQDTDRKAVIALMEKMQLYSWSQDVCVGGHKAQTSLDRLLRLALIAQSPQKAARAERRSHGEITAHHVEAATHETTKRLHQLETAMAKHEDNVDGSLPSIVTYTRQQHHLMKRVLTLLRTKLS